MDITLLKKGDHKAFAKLIDATSSDIFNLAMKFTSDYNDSKDITQEVYIEAFKNIKKFREESNIKTWLYRITVNRSLNHIKKEKNKYSTVDIDSVGQNIFLNSKSQSDAEAKIENKEMKMALEAALSKLPENQRVAFLLKNHEDMSYKEIAEIMELSISAIESLIFRAKAKLRVLLSNYYKNNFSLSQDFETKNV
ncbi:MAG: sigma-70 family RNA polymerase sigma factor [Bacteroidales bacterium]|jgi:RNA polymerase sigma-70 factor (ECF subfamily)|nr:sigma-70 family RNA polymerase sigma factor [Bacteroidales bacterium]